MNILAFAVRNARDQFPIPDSTFHAPAPDGPRPCCADFARVVVCDGDTDTWQCPVCDQAWTAPCPRPTV